MADPAGAVAPQQNTQVQNPTPISHTVAAGDTLSAIGAKYGVNWQDIYNANKGAVGPNPNMIRPGQILTIPGQGGAGTGGGTSSGNTTDFKLSVPSTVDSSTVSSAMTNPITQQDLEDAVAGNKNLGTKIAGEQTPTSTETNLSNQLADLRANEDASKLALRKYEGNLPQEGISTDAIRGRSGAMAHDVNLDLQTMALQEKNLMARLGIETATRKGELATDIATQKNNQSTITNFESMQRIIDTQKNQLATDASKLETGARTTLSTILTHFKGLDYQDLSPDGQKQITDLATNSGIPLDTIIKGMSVNKSQVQLSTLQKQNSIVKQQQSINGTGSSAKGNIKSGKLSVTPSQFNELQDSMNSHMGSHYIDTGVYVQALKNWTGHGGLQTDFVKHFPAKLLNPNDPTVPSYLKTLIPKTSSSSSSSFK